MIDIRDVAESNCEQINFGDANKTHNRIFTICRPQGQHAAAAKGAIEFVDHAGKSMFVQSWDVENLIKALQKAVELGWTK